jgi:hypothetical protein
MPIPFIETLGLIASSVTLAAIMVSTFRAEPVKIRHRRRRRR